MMNKFLKPPPRKKELEILFPPPKKDTLVKFPVALDLGCGSGSIRRAIADRGGVELLYQCDSSRKGWMHIFFSLPKPSLWILGE